MNKVVNAGIITSLDINPDRILEEAIGKVTEVVIIGYDKEGDLYFASSKADGGDVLWLLEKAKKELEMNKKQAWLELCIKHNLNLYRDE